MKTVIASITFTQLETINKFKRGTLLAKSRKQQTWILKAARFLITTGDIKGARKLLHIWKIEHKSYNFVLSLQDY